MVRSFAEGAVDDEVIRRVLDVARRGPSAGYSQGVEFVVVTDAATRRTFAAPADDMLAQSGHKNFVEQAPVHVVICVSPEIYRARYREPDKMRVVADWADEELWAVPYWHTDAGAALMLLLLAAVNEGLATAFVGVDQQLARDLLGVPVDYIPIGAALLGHEAADARQYGDVSADPRPRRPLSEIVHREHW